jgi:alpha-1,2-glucosyltransferase
MSAAAQSSLPEQTQRRPSRPGAQVLGYLCLALALVGALLFCLQQNFRVDEPTHFDQIRRFFLGSYTLTPTLTNIPGYHALMAALCSLYGATSVPIVRTLNAAFGAILIVVFALNLRAIHGGASLRRVTQFAFLPILFPYLFLVYTEVVSTLLVLLAVLATVRRRYVLAVLACGLGVLVRQPNIAWLLLPLIANIRQHDRWPGVDDLKSLARRFWPALLVVTAFAAFVVRNHGVALGQQDAHPSGLVPRVGNLYFLLLVYCLVFAPLVLGRLGTSLRYAREHRAAALAIAAAFVVYLLAFENTHPYNNEREDYYLHNYLLMTLAGSTLRKVVFFVPMALALLDLIAAPGFRRQRAAILLVTALTLLPSWLIEQRYYIIPFALLMLFRDEESPRLESVGALYAIGISAWLLYGIRTVQFFP